MIYFGIFSSIMTYGSLIWGQYNRIVDNLQTFQNKTLRIMNFQPFCTSATPLFKQTKILKLSDHITLQNILYAYDCLRNNLPRSLINEKICFLKSVRDLKGKRLNQLEKICTKTILYGSNSITSKSVETWNNINKQLYHLNLQDKSKHICKASITNFLLNQYQFR